jgi:hypothetical protein
MGEIQRYAVMSGDWIDGVACTFVSPEAGIVPRAWGPFVLHTDHTAALATERARIAELVAAAEEFCRKVECGEARSVRSYAQFKAALSAISDGGA